MRASAPRAVSRACRRRARPPVRRGWVMRRKQSKDDGNHKVKAQQTSSSFGTLGNSDSIIAANSAGLALCSPRGSVIACGGWVPWAGAAAAAVR